MTAFSCSEAGTFPHPWDCSKYYLCTEEGEDADDGQEEKEKKLVTTEYECLYDLTGLLFDTVTGSCVWAAKAKCFSDKVFFYPNPKFMVHKSQLTMFFRVTELKQSRRRSRLTTSVRRRVLCRILTSA